MNRQLPSKASLENLKNQAKQLLRMLQNREAEAAQRFRSALPDLHGSSDENLFAWLAGCSRRKPLSLVNTASNRGLISSNASSLQHLFRHGKNCEMPSIPTTKRKPTGSSRGTLKSSVKPYTKEKTGTSTKGTHLFPMPRKADALMWFAIWLRHFLISSTSLTIAEEPRSTRSAT